MATHGQENRKMQILHSIVRSYIETGEPVASRSVAKQRQDRLSSASVRNVMADLSDEGFLEQPHTSAGRIPTPLAYQSYVQSLAMRRSSFVELRRVRHEFHQVPTVDACIELSSHLLTEMTQSMGIAAAIPTSGQTLDHIELVLLDPRRVLMVLMTRDRMVRNRAVLLSQSTTQEELSSIRNYVNVEFAGWTIPAIQTELHRRLAEERARYDEVLRRLTQLYSQGLLDLGMTPEVHTDGASNLVGADLLLTRETMRDLLNALEAKERVLELLDRFLESPTGEIAYKAGLADIHPSMVNLALVGLKINLPSGMSAKVAVLGPLRMNYERVIAAVQQVGDAVQSLRV